MCNHHHSLDERLCRWLLLCLDRLPDNHLLVTQELIASLLGVRRAGVNASATNLQAEGILRYARGRICVLDRAALELRACECYGVVRDEYRRLLPVGTDAGGDRQLFRNELARIL